MASSEKSKQESFSYEELLQQNRALRHELEQFRIQESFIWNLFAETSRKFQVYSASIKAAVTSLLDHDIFWDAANQHEFLQTIDRSVNQVSEMTSLITLAFLSQANNLILSHDFHMIQEILSAAQIIATKKMPDIRMDISYPRDGQPVFVDYEYLTKALVWLCEVLFAQSPAPVIHVVAKESDNSWALEITGATSSTLEIIEKLHQPTAQPKSNGVMSAENVLRLYVMCEILHLQQISVDVHRDLQTAPILRLQVPTVIKM